MDNMASLKKNIQLHWPDFLSNYTRVYPNPSKTDLEDIVQIITDAYNDRLESLRKSDALRAAQPDWFQQPHHIGMMLYVQLFSKTLQDLKQHIPYIKELGITYLHLMPLLKPRTGPNDGGYAVADYRSVNPALGTMDDLRALAEALSHQGILLVVDFVMNHTAREHTWAQAALAGDAHYQDFYLMFDDRNIPDAYEQSLPEVFPDFAPGNFTFQPEINKWVWTTFYDFQWDLNFKNPRVFAAMLGEMLFLANCGVDVLRLDAVPFLWKKMGTNCQNQPEAVHLLAAYRALMRMVAPGVLFKSEAIVAPDDIIKYLGAGGLDGKVCEIGYNATLMNHLWHALASENTHLLRTTLSQLPAIPQQATWLNYIRCHDDIGWGISDDNAAAVQQDGRATRHFCTDFYTGAIPGSYAEGYVFQRDRQTGEARVSGTAAALTGLQKARIEADAGKIALSLRRLQLLNSIIFFMRGIPLIYSGDEIGQLNDFSYLSDPERAIDNRWVHRPPMNHSNMALRNHPGTTEQWLFDLHVQLARVRAAQPALHGQSSDHIIMPDNDHLFIAERRWQLDALLLVANFSQHQQSVSLQMLPAAWRGAQYQNVLNGCSLRCTSQELVVPPYGVFWLKPVAAEKPAEDITLTLNADVHTQFGDTVFFTGSNQALGAWKITDALPAKVVAYPRWSLEVQVPAGEMFAWQWIIVRDHQVIQYGDTLTRAVAGPVSNLF
jgi:amylosucrase